MLAHNPIRLAVLDPRRGHLLAVSMSAILTSAILSIISRSEVAVARARSILPEQPSVQIVNRAGKGDRLFTRHGVRQIEFAPALDVKLADGCEPLVSPLASARLAKVAARCVS
jgi:hypothetical protein